MMSYVWENLSVRLMVINVMGRNNSVDLFYLETEDSYYIAHFNYESGDKTGTIDFSYMNIDPENIDVSRSYECWTGEGVTLNEKGLEYSSPE